jgi:phytoene dehydrogenase-like protein
MAETSRQEQNLRVAIIGGGISGLTAAQQLASLGYDDVVIFEKDADVGGKIKTFKYENRPYELGALIFNHECPNVLQLAYRYGQPCFAAGKPLLIEQDGTVLTYQDLIKQRYGYLSFLAAAYRMLYGRTSHRYERDVGFADQDPRLFRSMGDFVGDRLYRLFLNWLRLWLLRRYSGSLFNEIGSSNPEGAGRKRPVYRGASRVEHFSKWLAGDLSSDGG